MPQTFISPPKVYAADSSGASSCQEVKMCDSSTPNSTSSSPVSSRSPESCYCDLPSPNRSPSKWSTSSNGSPTFRERLKSASRSIRKMHKIEQLNSTAEEEEKVEPVLKNQTSDNGFKLYFREHFILSELKLLSQNHQGGVYVMPSLNNIQVWYGIIFLRAGPYRDGIFRFFIFLPDDFPDSRPLLKFTTPVFHPQVHQNGVLNLDVAFPKWQKENHSIWQIIRYMKSCFYCADTWGATNQTAKNIIHSSIDEFKKKVEECVLNSQRLYNNELQTDYCDDDGNYLKVKRMNLLEMENGRKMMMQGKSVWPRNRVSNQ